MLPPTQLPINTHCCCNPDQRGRHHDLKAAQTPSDKRSPLSQNESIRSASSPAAETRQESPWHEQQTANLFASVTQWTQPRPLLRHRGFATCCVAWAVCTCKVFCFRSFPPGKFFPSPVFSCPPRVSGKKNKKCVSWCFHLPLEKCIYSPTPGGTTPMIAVVQRMRGPFTVTVSLFSRFLKTPSRPSGRKRLLFSTVRVCGRSFCASRRPRLSACRDVDPTFLASMCSS